MDRETITLVFATHLNVKKTMPELASYTREQRMWRKLLCPDLSAGLLKVFQDSERNSST
jgi:hypothetical protein